MKSINNEINISKFDTEELWTLYGMIIKRLKEIGAIRGFKPILNFEKTEILCKKVFIKYQGFSLAMEDQLVSFCKQSLNVIHIVKTFGEWDIIITVETRKTKDFNNFLLGLRERYEDIISDFEIVDVINTEELRYLPKNYFDDIKLKP